MEVLGVLVYASIWMLPSQGKVWNRNTFLTDDHYNLKCGEHLSKIFDKLNSVINPSTTTVAFDDKFSIFVKDLFSLLGAVQLSKNSDLSSTVTLVFKEGDLDTVKSPTNVKFWKPENFYFIFLINQAKSDRDQFLDLWGNFSVYNAFMVNCEDDHLTAYNPFRNELDYLPIGEISRRDVLVGRLNNWNGHEFYLINPGTLQRTGGENGTPSVGTYDDNIVEVISYSLNAKPILLETSGPQQFGFRHRNGSYLGTYKWLVNGSAFMTCGQQFLKWDSLDGEVPFSHYITMEKLCFTVPAVGQVPHFKAIFELLNVFTVAAILLIYLFAGLVYRLLRHFAARSQLRKRLHTVDITLAIISLLLGMSLNMKLKAGFERLLIGSLLLLNFIITTTFQSTLTTILSTPVYSKKVENKKELEEAGVEIWSSSGDIVKSLLENGYSRVNIKIVPPNTSSVGFHIGWLGRVNVMLESSFVSYRHYDNYFTNECPTTYSMVYFFNKGLPCKEKINHIISILIESGHIVKWVRESYQTKESTMIYKKESNKEPTVYKPLNITDMKYIFIFLSYSLTLSILIFIIETIQSLVHSKKKKKIAKVKEPTHIKFIN